MIKLPPNLKRILSDYKYKVSQLSDDDGYIIHIDYPIIPSSLIENLYINKIKFYVSSLTNVPHQFTLYIYKGDNQ